MQDKIKVVFVQNYTVSYAEHIIPAADVSEQISPAGTEASGTGNMKLMLNGAVTLGTFDGATVEIVEQAGEENNYIFGKTVQELESMHPHYDARRLYESEPRIRRAVDTLIDGTFSDGGTGLFSELYHSLLDGTSWHRPDPYYVLLELLPYVHRKLDVNRAYRDTLFFRRQGLINTASAGKFSSDRTIAQYAKEIWQIGPVFPQA